MYYLQGQTMETIARHLQISRSSVSRLLAHAREVGLVRISVSASPGLKGTLAGQIADLFGVQVSVVPVHDVHTEVNRLHNVALVAAEHLVDMLFPGVTLGIAWGNTTAEVTQAMPHVSFAGSTVVQLNGASDPVREGPSAGEVLSRMRLSLGARTISFPVPAFFDHVATREAMWSERSVKRVLSVVRRASLAVFGVGALDALNGALPSQVYEGGHLTARDQAVLRRQNVVGDVCTVLLRADGSWRDVTLNARATGPTPAQLARIPRRLCVAAGTGKARALLAALRARTATDLVVDDATARAVLELAEARGQKGGGSR